MQELTEYQSRMRFYKETSGACSQAGGHVYSQGDKAVLFSDSVSASFVSFASTELLSEGDCE